MPQDLADDYQTRAPFFQPEVNNLHAVLMYEITGGPTQELVDAVLRAARFAYWSAPTPTVMAALLLHVGINDCWHADLLEELSHCHLGRNEYPEALNYAQRAVPLYEKLRRSPFAAYCKLRIGKAYRMLCQYEDAEKVLGEAVAIFERANLPLLVAQCRMELGEVANQPSDTAIRHLTAARATFVERGQPFDAAQCEAKLAKIWVQRGEYAQATSALKAAMTEFERLGSQTSVVNCRCTLGSIDLTQGKLDDAQSHFEAAREVYAQSGSRLGMANCMSSLAEVAEARGQVQDALDKWGIAKSRSSTSTCRGWWNIARFALPTFGLYNTT
jgi:tetratricopeptide (TPR) repeat protein